MTDPARQTSEVLCRSHVVADRQRRAGVDDLHGALARTAADGYGLVGGVGQYQDAWRMAHVRGPEGIIVSLAQRIG